MSFSHDRLRSGLLRLSKRWPEHLVALYRSGDIGTGLGSIAKNNGLCRSTLLTIASASSFAVLAIWKTSQLVCKLA